MIIFLMSTSCRCDLWAKECFKLHSIPEVITLFTAFKKTVIVPLFQYNMQKNLHLAHVTAALN